MQRATHFHAPKVASNSYKRLHCILCIYYLNKCLSSQANRLPDLLLSTRPLSLWSNQCLPSSLHLSQLRSPSLRAVCLSNLLWWPASSRAFSWILNTFPSLSESSSLNGLPERLLLLIALKSLSEKWKENNSQYLLFSCYEKIYCPRDIILEIIWVFLIYYERNDYI